MAAESLESGILLVEENCSSDDGLAECHGAKTSSRAFILDDSGDGPLLATRTKIRQLVTVSGIIVGVAMATAACAWYVAKAPRLEAQKSLDLVQQQLINTQLEQVCSKSDEDMDYIFQGEWLQLVGDVETGEKCCALCHSQVKCRAWTWVRNSSKVEGAEPGQCWLKGGTMVQGIKKPGMVSALVASGESKANVEKQREGAEKPQKAEKPKDVEEEKPKQAEQLQNADKSKDAEAQTPKKAEKLRDAGKSEDAEEKPKDAEKPNEVEENVEKPKDAEKPKAIEGKPAVQDGPSVADNSKVENDKNEREEPKQVQKPEVEEKHNTEEMPESEEKKVEVQPLAKEKLENQKEAATKAEQPITQAKEEKTKAAEEEEDLASTCPAQKDGGCLTSKCCREPGLQCYAKNEYWAECMESCVPGPNLFDQGSNTPWTCTALGTRAPGKPRKCAEDGANCMDEQCCASSGMQCYAKNDTFGMCKIACAPGVNMDDQEDSKPWSCKAIGARSKAPAPWIEKKCANGFADCSKAKCCAETGMQCYLQNPYYGQCKAECVPTPGTNCSAAAAGPRTPRLASAIAKSKGKVGSWVGKVCSDKWASCLESKCCHEVGAACYAKNSTWATCREHCAPGPDPKDGNATWTCKALGPKSWGLSLKGYPSLYCFSLYMPSRYEGPLMKSQLENNAGIFACDGYDVFAAENDTLGTTKDGVTVKAVLIPKINVGVSQDGTAGNAKLFMAVWDKIIAGGRFRNYDWTIKVDPDAVLLASRLRVHMEPHVGENVYVVNCNKFPNSPNFPMMYGALEVFSKTAMEAYAAGSWKCGTQLPWKLWGEDYYMTHCLDFLHVGRISDFSVLGDNMCIGANCADKNTASFHPFKNWKSWKTCWDTANGHPPPPPPSQAPAW